jgi:hypothetical protein
MENEDFLKDHENYVSLQVPLSGTHIINCCGHCISILGLYGLLLTGKVCARCEILSPLPLYPLFWYVFASKMMRGAVIVSLE